VNLRELAANLDAVLKPGAVAVFPFEPVAFSPLMERVRKSRLVRRIAPVGNDIEDEEIIQANALADQNLPLRIQADPYHLTTQALNLIPISDRSARFLERFLKLSSEADNGCEELGIRLARLDRAIISRLPGVRRLCRHATLTMSRP
jgi:hypothetical protein